MTVPGLTGRAAEDASSVRCAPSDALASRVSEGNDTFMFADAACLKPGSAAMPGFSADTAPIASQGAVSGQGSSHSTVDAPNSIQGTAGALSHKNAHNVPAPRGALNEALAMRYAQVSATRDNATRSQAANGQSTDRLLLTDDDAIKKRRVVRVVRASSGARDDDRAPIEDVASVERPKERYSDFGGIEDVLGEIREIIERPFRFPHIYAHLGVSPARGVLLHGPPGCGKSSLAAAVAGELGVPLLRVSAPELVAGVSGESEARIRALFAQARRNAPCILFVDEIDAICPKREGAQREMERRVVAQLLTAMDSLGRPSADAPDGSALSPLTNTAQNTQTDPLPGDSTGSYRAVESYARVMVIGATNRPDALDPALRRAGRFDRELRLGVPSEGARLCILRTILAPLRMLSAEDREAAAHELARLTPGYVGADMRALCREAAATAVRRLFAICSSDDTNASMHTPSALAPEPEPALDQIEELAVTVEDLRDALRRVQPAVKREGFASVPGCRWADVGALQHVRRELRMAVVEPMRHPELFARAGVRAPAGVLLWGPPGCGKTLLARAVAAEAAANFLSVKGPELLSRYVGDSERAVRTLFERARQSAPCVVFFDEIDALCPTRESDSGGSDVTARVVNQMLTEMDGVEGGRAAGVYVLAATNRPDMVDPAMTRPGRLDRALYVPLPDAAERADILRTVGRATPWAADVDLDAVAHDARCAGFSGADLASLVREAALAAVRDALPSYASNAMCDEDDARVKMELDAELFVTAAHVAEAFKRVVPSVSASSLARYLALASSMNRISS